MHLSGLLTHPLNANNVGGLKWSQLRAVLPTGHQT
jgi:hypothetical protein